MKKIILLTLVLASFFALLVVISGHSSDSRQGVVTAKPLACQQIEQKLVCFDGNLQGTLVCKDISDQTVLCSSQS